MDRGLDDMEIINRVVAGEKEKFSILIDRYAPLFFLYFRQRGVESTDTIHDLMQETFLKVFTSLPKFRPFGSFKAWLLTICRGTVSNYHSSRQKESGNRSNPLIEQYSAGFEKDVIQTAIVNKALSELSDIQRETVVMKYFWQLGCSEIADLLNLPLGTVKSHLFHARKRLWELLKEKDL